MKKIFVILIAFAVMLSTSPIVFADDNPTNSETTIGANDDSVSIDEGIGAEETTTIEEDVEEEAGVTPDQIIYPLERLFESIQLTFTLTEDGKTELLVQFANERLAEAEIMTQKDKQELALEVMEIYTETITKANERLEKAIEEEKEVRHIVEKVEIVESNADQVVIKVTGVVSDEVAKELTEKITHEVEKTIALKVFALAKQNFFDAKKQFELAKDAYKQAKESGDEAAIKEAQEKLIQAEQYKDEMEQIKDDIEGLKEEIKKELEKRKKESIDKEDDEDDDDKDEFKKALKNEEKELKEVFKKEKEELKVREKAAKEALKKKKEELKKAKDHDDDDDDDDDDENDDDREDD